MLRHAIALALIVAVPALASAKKPLRVTPWIFDPQDLGGIYSDWQPFSGPGNSDPALVMEKQLMTAQFAAAGASVEEVAGLTLGELGFDVWNGGHCGAGAPRFDVSVTMPDGTSKLFFFGCVYGTHTPAPDKPATFTRVRFADSDAFPQDGVSLWPGFGKAIVESIDIVFDEGVDIGPDFTGETALDNIDVNGELVGRGHGR